MQRHFEQELEALKQSLIRMGSLVDDQLDKAFTALFSGDTDLASRVIAADAQVDEYDSQIEKECQRIFALIQPVAVDLRLLLAALGINSQLERVGDIAVNVAERAEPLAAHNGFLRSTPLSDMAYIARTMVKDSIEAFVNQDPALATRVLESDDVVDGIGRDIFHQLVARMKQIPALVEPAAHILILSRHIERLADHATNVAEQVIFLVDSRRVKHHAFELPPG